MKKTFGFILTNKWLSLLLIFVVIVSSCSKKNGTDNNPPVTPPGQTDQLSDADSLKYLMYRLMQNTIVDGGRDKTTHFPLYFWYKDVPALDPLSGEYATAQDLLKKMQTFTIGPDGKALDRYSFLDDGSVLDQLQGNAGDLGMDVSYVRDQTGTISLIVISTDKNSPSGKVGVNRGWVISSINGGSVDYDNGGPNYKRIVNAIYGSDPQATFTFKRPDGTSQTNTLVKSSYAINPILFDTVYNVGGQKVGYFVYNTFTSLKDSNNVNTLAGNELDRVFNKFSSNNISSLIVDLRYNGGGDVSTAVSLTDRIAPASLNGKEMFHQSFNDLLNNEFTAEGVSNNTNFDGSGNLSLQNVFFIGTRSTASASELVYNSLRPYMNVKLVGDTTYGKPVGFWVMQIFSYKNNVSKFLANLFPVAFESLNSADQGGYYAGLLPDKKAVDYVNVPWGNVNDDNLEKIFSYISTGSFGRISSVQEKMRENPNLRIAVPSAKKFPSLRFNGMVEKGSKKIFNK